MDRYYHVGTSCTSWSYGKDMTGDGVADLVTISKTGLRVFAGTADPKKDLRSQ